MQINKHISLLEIAHGKYIIISKKTQTRSITDKVENIERKNKQERERDGERHWNRLKPRRKSWLVELTKFARRQRKYWINGKVRGHIAHFNPRQTLKLRKLLVAEKERGKRARLSTESARLLDASCVFVRLKHVPAQTRREGYAEGKRKEMKTGSGRTGRNPRVSRLWNTSEINSRRDRLSCRSLSAEKPLKIHPGDDPLSADNSFVSENPPRLSYIDQYRFENYKSIIDKHINSV